jgi:hypothetical protein
LTVSKRRYERAQEVKPIAPPRIVLARHEDHKPKDRNAERRWMNDHEDASFFGDVADSSNGMVGAQDRKQLLKFA